jgi:hypothetical protein
MATPRRRNEKIRGDFAHGMPDTDLPAYGQLSLTGSPKRTVDRVIQQRQASSQPSRHQAQEWVGYNPTHANDLRTDFEAQASG